MGKSGFMGGRKPYLLVGLLGVLAGIGLYHFYSKSIDSVWDKIPYVNQYKSHFAVSNIGSEL